MGAGRSNPSRSDVRGRRRRQLFRAIRDDDVITDQTRQDLLTQVNRADTVGGLNRVNETLQQAQTGGTDIFRDRQRRERTRTLLADRPGRRGLV